MTREEAITVLRGLSENPLFSNQHKAAFSIAIHDIKAHHDWDINDLILINKDNYEPLEQEPTTKNDLGVDCIDRAELLKAMDIWDKFGYTARYGLERLDKDDKGFVPYVKYDDMVNCVKGMPSVTPIRPKGHWISMNSEKQSHTKDGMTIESIFCSECGKWLTASDEYACYGRYCPNCGADMREVEE